ncbi:MAG: hypothetical protein RMJ88_10405, partial [Thermogemmata sp.]|nr:hypothetical protein [Thermogemmata sp.]
YTEPAGKVTDWLELCQWAREQSPGPALQALIDADQTVSAAQLEQELIDCFLRAGSWPLAAEELLEAALCRLFEDRLIGLEYRGDPEEVGTPGRFGLSCRLISRLAELVAQPGNLLQKEWERHRRRAGLLLWLAERLQAESDEEDRRTYEIEVALRELAGKSGQNEDGVFS